MSPDKAASSCGCSCDADRRIIPSSLSEDLCRPLAWMHATTHFLVVCYVELNCGAALIILFTIVYTAILIYV